MKTFCIIKDEWYPVHTIGDESDLEWDRGTKVTVDDETYDELYRLQDKMFKAFNELQEELGKLEKAAK